MKRKCYDLAGKNFTLRHLQITSKLSDGLVHKEIAEELGISKGTVDHTVAHIFHSKGFKNSKELVAHASANGLEPNGYFKGKNLFKGEGRNAAKKPRAPRKK
jgi:DNA-binding NarL/FixJ family response regulator